MRINVRGGTVDHGRRSLCESCRWATIIRGPKLGDEIVECYQLSYPSQRVLFPVTSCSKHVNRGGMILHEMQEIAWVLRTDARRNPAGFVHASKLEEDDRYSLRGK